MRGGNYLQGLKRDGRIVARGESVVPQNGNTTVNIQTAGLSDGEYELWLTINRDNLESCYPSYGDLFVRQKWNVQRASSALTLT